jgi:TrmH family RNA methyltransferase
MSNFGFSRLRLVNPYQVAFQEARSAVHAHKILREAEEFPALADAIADCSLVVGTTSLGHRELQHTLRSVEKGGPLIRKRLAAAPVALLFGSEKFGLSNEDLSYCHWLLNIPTGEENISLNLGQAVAVCLYELIRDPKTIRQAERVAAATSGELERITTLLLEVLRTSGYIELRRVADIDDRIRRLVRRLKLPARDTDLWLGMLRQILWKVKTGGHPERQS